jgi:hypothetical protein
MVRSYKPLSKTAGMQRALLASCIIAVLLSIARLMEAEQLNQIANRLTDLHERNLALRGYL